MDGTVLMDVHSFEVMGMAMRYSLISIVKRGVSAEERRVGGKGAWVRERITSGVVM